MKFKTACSKFFGKQPGQTLKELMAELDELTPADREELAPLLAAELGEPVEV